MYPRKAHTKPKFTNMDLSKPLDINVIGSTEDPCFGKHHSLTASQCRICGDNEVCSIITAQLVNTRLRAKEERTHRFKDLEEAELLAVQEKAIRVSIKKLASEKPCALSKVVKRVAKKVGYTPESAMLLVKSYIAKRPNKYHFDSQTQNIRLI